jgi:hypothetical protein
VSTTTGNLRLLGEHIQPGYGRAAVFGKHAQEVDFGDDVQVAALLEHGGDLDLDREECARIIRNVREGRQNPWNP